MDCEGLRRELETAGVLTGLSDHDLTLLAPGTHIRTFGQGAEFICMDQPGEAVYVILAGSVRIEALEDVQRIIIAYLAVGDIVGEMSLVDNTARCASAVALEPCRLLWTDRRTFLTVLDASPRMCRELLEVVSRRLRLADSRIRALATKDVPCRVAMQLVAFATAYGETLPGGSIRIKLRLPQEEIADYIGASRTTVNQTMVEMREHGLISVDTRRRVTVKDINALTRRYR